MNPANLAPGTAAINISGTAATAIFRLQPYTGNIADFQHLDQRALAQRNKCVHRHKQLYRRHHNIATNGNNLFNGTFTGNLTGNATTASSAAVATSAVSAHNFTGPLSAKWLGHRAATTVLTVGGSQLRECRLARASAANSATSANTAVLTIVKRDASGNLHQLTITATTVNAAFNGNGSALTNLNPSQLNFGSAGNIAIGVSASPGDSDTLRIGAPTTQTNAFIAGIYGATAAGDVPVYVTSQLPTRHVDNPRANTKRISQHGRRASDALLALHPVTFRYKPAIDPAGIPQFGLVAEEVEKVNPDLVAHDTHGQPYTVRYEAVNAMLLNEFLKEHRKVEAQTAKIDELTQRLRPRWRKLCRKPPANSNSLSGVHLSYLAVDCSGFGRILLRAGQNRDCRIGYPAGGALRQRVARAGIDRRAGAAAPV